MTPKPILALVLLLLSGCGQTMRAPMWRQAERICGDRPVAFVVKYTMSVADVVCEDGGRYRFELNEKATGATP